MSLTNSKLIVKTPAKLILSGEHAVVHGCPALAIAINRYTQTKVSWSSPLHFSFNLLGIDFRQKVTLEALKRLKRKLHKQYQDFHSGHIHIRDVLSQPFELTLFTAINVIEKIKHTLPMGINIETDSNIPIGCGMGSSAANVVSVIYALSQFLKTNFSLEDYIRLGIESENLQHGHSSGIDIHVVYHGGALHYQNGQVAKRELNTNIPFTLIQTGKPQSTTGECVSHTKSLFNPELKAEFTHCVETFDNALKNNDENKVKECMRHNHRLLTKIGVVPSSIQQLAHEIEESGAAMKICGAGTVIGQQAGAVLVAGNNAQEIQAIAKQHGFFTTPVEIEQRGTHVVSS